MRDEVGCSLPRVWEANLKCLFGVLVGTIAELLGLDEGERWDRFV